jgi:hypothetical protein
VCVDAKAVSEHTVLEEWRVASGRESWRFGWLADTAQDALDACGGDDESAKLKATAALVAFLDIDLEGAEHELAPGPVPGAMRGRLVGAVMTGRCLISVGRSRKRRNDGRAQLGGGSEDACLSDDVKAWGRNCGGEATEERERIEIDSEGAIAEGAAELDTDEVAGQKQDAVVSDGRAEDVADESLATERVVGASGGCGVEREAQLEGREGGGERDAGRAAKLDGNGKTLAMLGPRRVKAGDGGVSESEECGSRSAKPSSSRQRVSAFASSSMTAARTSMRTMRRRTT